MQPKAFFLPAEVVGTGQRFCLFHSAERDQNGGAIRGLVLYIHPFAEEMNKARRMAALQARALAQAGFSVLQLDLLGCGDSSGDFGDAHWEAWIRDVVLGCRWLRGHGDTRDESADTVPLWLWGLRAGCLLAVEAAKHLDETCNFLFWQPPSSGKPLLRQFLRLSVAGDMLGNQSNGSMQSMRNKLTAGSAVEIAGYTLDSSVAAGLEEAELVPPAGRANVRRMEWFELSTSEHASLIPASAKTIAEWQRAGFHTSSQLVRGPAFWQTNEIEIVPALIAATVDALRK